MYTLNVFEKARNSLIQEGLIKAKPSFWCKTGLERQDPCYICNTDAMCTELDISTGTAKHTFFKGYKKYQMVKLTIRVVL